LVKFTTVNCCFLTAKINFTHPSQRIVATMGSCHPQCQLRRFAHVPARCPHHVGPRPTWDAASKMGLWSRSNRRSRATTSAVDSVNEDINQQGYNYIYGHYILYMVILRKWLRCRLRVRHVASSLPIFFQSNPAGLILANSHSAALHRHLLLLANLRWHGDVKTGYTNWVHQWLTIWEGRRQWMEWIKHDKTLLEWQRCYQCYQPDWINQWMASLFWDKATWTASWSDPLGILDGSN